MQDAIRETAKAIASTWLEAVPELGYSEATLQQIESTTKAAERYGVEYEEVEAHVYLAIDVLMGGK